MRLNLFIAKSTAASRRGADSLIKKGRVKVNGEKVLQPYHEVKEDDSVCFDGEKLNLKEQIYLIFNKPKGVTTTTKDRFAEKKITDFFPERYSGVYPVGRLDKDSHGLIILTNDGDLCYELTHPKFEVEKEYLIYFKGEVKKSIIEKACSGVVDAGETLRLKQCKILKKTHNSGVCKVLVGEGKKRHIRRLFKALGLDVVDLQRVRIGRLNLGALEAGKYKKVEKDRIRRLIFLEK